MRVLYIAPRYHTNQTAIVHGWQLHRDEVCFIVRATGPIEDHRLLKPVMVPYASSFGRIENLYQKIYSKDPFAHDIGLRYGYPNHKQIKDAITTFQPDLVILREKSVYSLCCYRICIRYCKQCHIVLYNQSPMYDSSATGRKDPGHWMIDHLLPVKRYTPVRGSKRDGNIDKMAFFVPFITELHCSPAEKKYFSGNRINLLMIGRFEKRKNHVLMVNAFRKVHDQQRNAYLTIVGEACNCFEKECLAEVSKLIKAEGLEDSVRILPNLDAVEMDKVYRDTDLFILPSTGEPAAISPLEAMSYSIPAISSTGNGTADYIDDGVSGSLFMDNDVNDLTRAILAIVSDRELLIRMGTSAYINIQNNYLFDNYYRALKDQGLLNE